MKADGFFLLLPSTNGQPTEPTVSNAGDKLHFDQADLGAELMRYAEWMEPVKKARNWPEYRARTEAVVVWLQEQKKKAPPEQQQWIDSTISQLQRSVASMPKRAKPAVLPDLFAGGGTVAGSEIVTKSAVEALRELEIKLGSIQPDMAQDISHCLAASRGIPVPGEGIEYHHLFAMVFKGVGLAIAGKDMQLLRSSMRDLERWAQKTALNPGFDRKAVERHVKNITDLVPKA